jgi:hypothetical protein
LAAQPAPKGATLAAPATKPGTPTPAPQKPVAPKPASTVGIFHMILAIFALVANLAAVGTMIFMMNLLDKTKGMVDDVLGQAIK